MRSKLALTSFLLLGAMQSWAGQFLNTNVLNFNKEVLLSSTTGSSAMGDATCHVDNLQLVTVNLLASSISTVSGIGPFVSTTGSAKAKATFDIELLWKEDYVGEGLPGALLCRTTAMYTLHGDCSQYAQYIYGSGVCGALSATATLPGPGPTIVDISQTQASVAARTEPWTLYAVDALGRKTFRTVLHMGTEQLVSASGINPGKATQGHGANSKGSGDVSFSYMFYF